MTETQGSFALRFSVGDWVPITRDTLACKEAGGDFLIWRRRMGGFAQRGPAKLVADMMVLDQIGGIRHIKAARTAALVTVLAIGLILLLSSTPLFNSRSIFPLVLAVFVIGAAAVAFQSRHLRLAKSALDAHMTETVEIVPPRVVSAPVLHRDLTNRQNDFLAMGRRAVHRKRGGVFGAARRLSELGGYTLRQALIGDVVLHMIVKLIPFGILAAVVGALAAPFALDGMSLGPVLAGIVILIYIVHSIVFLTAVARIRLRRARRYRLCERALLDVLQNAIHSETPVSPTRWEALEIARWAAWVRIERGRSIWFRMTRPGRP